MRLSPTTVENRIEALDITRGFALLGIFIANMLLFHTPYLHVDPYSWFINGDAATFKWIDIFVQGSFYPIFALLFGYGINMQYEKSIQRNTPFVPIMARRLWILLGIGLLHGLFIWSGDVLFTYAVMGFLLLIFVRIPAKWLALFAGVLYIIPAAFMYIVTKLLMKANSNLLMSDYVDTHQIERSIEAFGSGSFGNIFVFRFFEWLLIGLGGTFMGFFIVLPIIMFGAALSKWKVIERAKEFKIRLVVIAVLSLAAGIWIKLLPHLKKPTLDLIQLQDTIGNVILAAGYVSLLLLLCTIPLFRVVFRPIGKAGRMSLTTYIMQSVVATLIFYSYGFGLYGKVDLGTGTWIALGVFAVQVMFAELWLSKFRMGPLEWFWRKGTYGRNLTKKEE
ncbi:DUF418 domain-containing protein [Sporosarcina sp. Marseille-Q4063]|uniref:DUF418 domain-containing protein n=1 Tax=Sporosarcina sp. Marseille-Q4063 TaxID=2810514 RepID=UPI001BB0685C|nr:DUF418 domain-containing protein [Sporosarcina sp. Marseille-Q4063]QUW21658.1 DUF418 domain-containing protein [Sporosarcina sp. Marseille-Q4063]